MGAGGCQAAVEDESPFMQRLHHRAAVARIGDPQRPHAVDNSRRQAVEQAQGILR